MEDHFKTGVPNGARPALFVPKRRDSPATEDVKRDVTRLDLWGSNGSPDPLGLIWESTSPNGGIFTIKTGVPNGVRPAFIVPKRRDSPETRGRQTGRHLPGLFRGSSGSPNPFWTHLGVQPQS